MGGACATSTLDSIRYISQPLEKQRFEVKRRTLHEQTKTKSIVLSPDAHVFTNEEDSTV